eukprot:1161696-Pelagomonas_calceolata.AAC.33
MPQKPDLEKPRPYQFFICSIHISTTLDQMTHDWQAPSSACKQDGCVPAMARANKCIAMV